MYVIYSLLLTLAAFLSSPYWLIRGVRQKKYFGTIRQRLSWRLPRYKCACKPLWLHAVSVGEVLAAKVLFAALRAARPDLPIVVSTVTLTGQALAKKELPAAAAHFYFPYDWGFCVRRFLRRVDPLAVVLLETEMWPNFIKECGDTGVPVLITNGRISDASFGRYSRVRFLTSSMLGRISAIGAQTAVDGQRFVRLGAAPEKVRITGNLKFDFAAPDLDAAKDLIQALRCALQTGTDSPVIVVGSSMKGEESFFLDAFRSVRAAHPAARLIIAPRHPERFEEVGQLLQNSGFPFSRRSNLESSRGARADILLVDSVGELRQVYSMASVAVIGGSFLPFGGHNPLEPAALGRAIVFGPEMNNFREVAHILLREQAARQCTAEDLGRTLIDLLSDAGARNALGQRALASFKRNQGAAASTLSLMLSHIE